jgi:hypothetical protein
MDVRSAETNGSDIAGCYVNVKGNMKILGYAPNEYIKSGSTYYKTANSSVYAFSDRINGGAPLFTVGSLTVEENAIFTASRLGFASGLWYDKNTILEVNYEGSIGYNGFGPGAGNAIIRHGSSNSDSINGGGGHGGKGAYAGGYLNYPTIASIEYDDPLRPTLAGSGGSGRRVTYGRAFGGGVIHVKAEKGITVDGTISSDGETSTSVVAGGAGGSILLECRTFSGSGLLSACGGNGKTTTSGSTISESGGGGGGRIAIWTGKPWESDSKLKHCVVSDTPVSTFSGTYNVAGGIDTFRPENTYGLGGVGTIKFVEYLGEPGLSIILK